jgi:Sulfotransferase family
MPLPTFLVIGAAKSGTTALAAYLAQHPEVFFSRSKEPNYFALAGEGLPELGPAPPHVLRGAIYNWSRTDWTGYCRLFEGAEGSKAIGEASVRYLYFPDAPPRIRTILPDVRLIVLLRDPISRLYSHYNMNRQILLEPLELAEAIAAEPERIAAGWGWDWHYVQLGLYARQLRRYFELFDRAQIAVFLYDDFVRDPLAIYRAVCRHIGVDDSFVPDMRGRAKPGSLPRNAALARWLWWPNPVRRRLLRHARPLAVPLIRRLKDWNAAPVPALDPGLHRVLVPRFRADLDDLARLLDRDIPWYRPAAVAAA